IDFKAAVLGLPPVERLLADAVPAAELGRLAARLGLFQDPDDLLFGEPFPTHRGALPAGILSRILTHLVAEFSGSTSRWRDHRRRARRRNAPSEARPARDMNVIRPPPPGFAPVTRRGGAQRRTPEAK